MVIYQLLGGDGSEDEAEDLAPERGAYIIRSYRRRDRRVQTIEAALDLENYVMLPPVTEEKKHEITVTGTCDIFR